MSSKVRLSDQAVKELKKIDRVNREMILSYLEQRIEGCSNPRLYGKPLKDNMDHLWRYRVGQYRLICEIDHDIITVYIQGGTLMKLIDTIQEWISSLAVSLALAIFINVFVVQHMVVEGHSMDPTLQDSQHVMISKLSHSINKLPSYGDIVTIDSRVTRARSLQDDLSEPITNLVNRKKYVFVKRVIGKPGDVLEFKENQVYRNGIKVDEPYILDSMNEFIDKKITVPDNSIFVMGDNRNNSMDSRFIGAIPLDHVLGVMVGKL